MDYQENSNNSGTSTNDLRQRMMDYLIRTEKTTQPGPFTYILHKAPFDAQAYEAEEEVDQHLGYLSDFESVSTASPRQSPQSPITWSDSKTSSRLLIDKMRKEVKVVEINLSERSDKASWFD
ncbi:hypothetical protein I307_05659 [Cryptococcus deuterogattii 99/473]|uniref:Uncharacterized protein n=1 Tax=Cryptococcus deuterogattii Ram5 TaxID=1296110 RepID=A0A0D0UWR1_9TREE|nr:hypothetical protein I313_05677 [Cryptococcus deuterogattii Ram5]KIR70548.1 hypothetical protein I310_05799 [Cryptococcus deuterogattii CA1014]KIR96934.1 hypothetical protein L804_05591 [Cryptococcus deuterogattii 2001/935-1]KIY55008.1 hypothetical protein I307_05659 [Cryptococcus deuterogattii 99/473]